jgi:hypothetical protein
MELEVGVQRGGDFLGVAWEGAVEEAVLGAVEGPGLFFFFCGVWDWWWREERP